MLAPVLFGPSFGPAGRVYRSLRDEHGAALCLTP